MNYVRTGQVLTSQSPLSGALNCELRNVSLYWVVWFCICLYPITLAGFGLNYLFALTPIFYAIAGGRLYSPSALVKVLLVFSIGVFSVASIYQYQFYDEGLRRIISFLLFMTIFSLTFMDMKYKHFNSFVLALILVSCLLSAISVYKLIALGLVQSAFEAKDEVGSQRYGFLLVFAFWATLSYARGGGSISRAGVISMAALLFSGVILTFSRASLVSIAASGALYMMLDGNRVSLRRIFQPVTVILISVGILFFFIGEYAFPSIYQFFEVRFFEFILSGRVFEHLYDTETSEGTRIRIWFDILQFVINHPLTGSGFLGSWVLAEDTGSSHSQYFDVLFRIGFIGFILYAALLWQVWNFLKDRNGLLLCGFCGVLIYGMFHETFKEPSGSFLLAILLSCLCALTRQSRGKGFGRRLTVHQY